jgi:hypothetical protein
MPLTDPKKDIVDQQRLQNDIKYKNRDEKSGYSIGTYEYPEDLRQRLDLQHYVAFYVLVREKSTLGKQLKEGGLTFDRTKESPELDRPTARITAQDAGKGVKFITNNIGILAGAGVLLSDLVQGKFNIIRTPLKAGLAGAGSALGVSAINSFLAGSGTTVLDPGTTSRLKEVITLHLEERPSVKYGINYTDKDMGVLTGALVQGSVAGVAKGSGIIGEGFARAISELLKFASLGGNTLDELRELSTATKTNAFRQALFESVDYRTFNFRYKFFPKSQKETDAIKRIIEMFKMHMHPELSPNKLFFIYPSEFEIRYFFKNDENHYFHKIGTCALTDMQVDYGGDQFSSFEDGAPTEIGLSLTFRELEQVTTQGVQYGL